MQLCLNLLSMSCRILIRKLTFLGKLMTTENSTISSAIFTAQAIVEPFNISIIQQCKMLEAMLGVQVLGECLQCPSMIVRYQKQSLLDTDMSSLVISAKQDNSAQLVAAVAQQISWRKLWDMALDKGSYQWYFPNPAYCTPSLPPYL